MNDAMFWLVLRATVLLMFASLCVAWLMRWRPLSNPRGSRIAWGIVLVQGLAFFPLPLAIPVPAESFWPRSPVQVAPIVELPSQEPKAPESEPVAQFQRQTVTAHSARVVLADFQPTSQRLFVDPVMTGDVLQSPGRTGWLATSATASSLPSSSTVAVVSETASLAMRPEFLLSRLVPLVVGLWIVGVLFVVFRLSLNFIRLQRVLSQCGKARPRWSAELGELLLELGCKDSIPLLVHPRFGPFLCWSPTGHRIVVPVRLWTELTVQERKAVLHHELCHLRRGDLLKSCFSRLVVAIHWFNPFAWFAAKRFDEAAEWSCDLLLAMEAPSRVPCLARAIVCASHHQESCSPSLVVAATGGALVQRVRRLVANTTCGDSAMKKVVWGLLLVGLLTSGIVDPRWQTREVVAQESPNEGDATKQSTGAPGSGTAQDSRVAEYASRIIVADNDALADFVRVLREPQGNIVMADRAALAAEEAMQNIDGSDDWSRYVESRFVMAEGKWAVVPERREELTGYIADVSQSLGHIGEIQQVLIDVASKLSDQHELAPALRRFLEHEGTATHIYASELRRRLRPGADEIIERFDNLFVKVDNGYLIRPTRRGQAAQLFAWLDQSRGALQRLQKELVAWADDLVKTDEQHRDFATTLRSPAFAMFLLLDHADGESALDDEQLSNIFYVLEDATRDTAAGLVLDTDSEEYQEMRDEMNRFEGAWSYREPLMKELSKFAGQVVGDDELHRRWKNFLSSEAAFLYVVRNAEYSPIDAESACREMLSSLLTQNEEGKYDITIESGEDLTNQIEDYYRQFREIRRRGRVIDDFAGGLNDSSLATAMKPMIGKMLLFEVVKDALPPANVDGLALWFESRFEETSEGLKLYDWATEEIASVVNDAAELERELGKQDF